MKRKHVFFLVLLCTFVFFGQNRASASGDNTCSTKAVSGVDSCTMSDGTTKGTCVKASGDTKPMCYVVSSTSTTANGTKFTNPLNFTTVEGLLGGLLGAVQKIIVSLALVFIAIGALLYITAGANPENAENGKKAITAALVGLAIGIAAPSILQELGNTIGWNGTSSSAVAGSLTLSQIAIKVLDFLLGIMGVIALIMLVIGAIMYLTSAGDQGRVDKGKEIFKYSLLGVVIAMASMVIVTQIAQFFVAS